MIVRLSFSVAGWQINVSSARSIDLPRLACRHASPWRGTKTGAGCGADSERLF
jgi:hypothetical protein